MSKTVIKNCSVCGAEYPACTFCDSQNEFLAWRSVVCKVEHMAYHLPIIRYIRGQISKEQAKTELLAAERQYGKIDYANNIKQVVAEIKSEDKPINDLESKPLNGKKRGKKAEIKSAAKADDTAIPNADDIVDK